MLMQEDQQNGEGTWAFHDDSEASVPQSQQPATANPQPISWTGSEFISNQKNGGWYLALTGFIIVICAIIYFISKDIISIVFIAIMGVLFAIIAGRKPRELQYSIDDQGVHVGQKSYMFTDFKSFSLNRHGAIGYVSLLPLHRFHNELSIYFPPENEQAIFDALATHIPNEQRRETSVDKLTKLIRF